MRSANLLGGTWGVADETGMARQGELASFLVDVEGLERAAEEIERHGSGAYGYVFKVSVGGVERIAKKLHSSFVDPSQVSVRERESIASKFRNECVILSKLRHPNIVQFIGVHYGRRGRDDLTLIMECVNSDMDEYLRVNPNIPLPVKLSVLLGISNGLVYLHHEHNPPIVHRDLTARNILITDKCQAKIADLGMAKIVDIQQQLAKGHTQTPGQQYYMPPEVLIENALCTTKLDIFSFGHLILYAVNQEFPGVVDVSRTITHDMQRQGIVEIKKREKAIDKVGECHCLYQVIINCLHDLPENRPATRTVNSDLINLLMQSSALTTSADKLEIARLQEALELQEKKTIDARAEVFITCRACIYKLSNQCVTS
jgi:serine/threonine protein kinase